MRASAVADVSTSRRARVKPTGPMTETGGARPRKGPTDAARGCLGDMPTASPPRVNRILRDATSPSPCHVPGRSPTEPAWFEHK
jgi:hypothetical protein